MIKTNLDNPLSELLNYIIAKEESGYTVIGIMIHPITYFKYSNNSFIIGLKQLSDEFIAFPGLKRIFNNNMPLNKIVLLTEENMVNFMVEDPTKS